MVKDVISTKRIPELIEVNDIKDVDFFIIETEDGTAKVRGNLVERVQLDNVYEGDPNKALGAEAGKELMTTKFDEVKLDGYKMNLLANNNIIQTIELPPDAEIINSFDGGKTSVLSAEMGKFLQETKIDSIELLSRELQLKADGKTVGTVELPEKTVIINNLHEGGSFVALSAEMGKELNENKIDKIEFRDNKLFLICNGEEKLEPVQLALPTVVVNNLHEGGNKTALSAEMGRTLNTTKIDELSIDGYILKAYANGDIVHAVTLPEDRPLVDNLHEGGETSVLSAEQGKVLNGMIGDLIDTRATINDIVINIDRDENMQSDYSLTEIPKMDSLKKPIAIDLSIAYDDVSFSVRETARSCARRTGSTLVVNAGVFESNGKPRGIVIRNGEILQDRKVGDTQYVLGIKKNNELIDYPANTPAQTLVNNGIWTAFRGIIPLIKNGTVVGNDIRNQYSNWGTKSARQIITRDDFGVVRIITIAGGSLENKGMTCDEAIALIRSEVSRLNYAFLINSGNQANLVHRGRYLVQSTTVEDRVPLFMTIGCSFERERDMEVIGQNEINGELDVRIRQLRNDFDRRTGFSEGHIEIMRNGNSSDANIRYGNTSVEGEVVMSKTRFANIPLDSSGNRLRELIDVSQNSIKTHNAQIDAYGELFKVAMRTSSGAVNSTPVINVDSNGDLSTKKGILGIFNKTSKKVTNVNTLTEQGVYFTESDASGVPNTSSKWFILNLVYDNIIKLQFALPYTNTANLKNSYMRSSTGISNWGSWSTL